jgi:hypothetical protein
MNGSEGIGPLLVPLACPFCGADLASGPGDRIGLCLPCGKAFVLGSEMRHYPVGVVEPALRMAGRPRLLPFWKMNATWAIRIEESRARYYDSFPDRGSLLFPAFWSPRLAYHGDLTWRFLTQSRPLEMTPPEGPFLGGVRSPGVIPEMGRLAVLSYLDRIADVGNVVLELTVQGIEYVGIPFWRDGDGWVDGIFGLRFPGSLSAG